MEQGNNLCETGNFVGDLYTFLLRIVLLIDARRDSITIEVHEKIDSKFNGGCNVWKEENHFAA